MVQTVGAVYFTSTDLYMLMSQEAVTQKSYLCISSLYHRKKYQISKLFTGNKSNFKTHDISHHLHKYLCKIRVVLNLSKQMINLKLMNTSPRIIKVEKYFTKLKWQFKLEIWGYSLGNRILLFMWYFWYTGYCTTDQCFLAVSGWQALTQSEKSS